MQVVGRHVTITGTLAPHKGHESFLRAAQRIRQRRTDTVFNIVGSAARGGRAWTERLRALSRELSLTESVRFWGFVPDAVARDVLAASDLFVLPTTIEGFGLVIAEALACGVPVVTSAIRPLEEVVTDGKSGFLAPPRDFAFLAGKVLELLESPETMREFSVYGREPVRASFSAKAVVGRITHCYDEMLHPK